MNERIRKNISTEVVTYTAGMLDGEGTIRANIQKHNKYNTGYRVSLKVMIAQKIEQDASLHKRLWAEPFKYVCQYLDVPYSIYQYDEGYKYKFEVGALDAVEKFLTVLEPHTKIKKKQINIMLDEIIPFMRKKKHLSQRGLIQLSEIKDRMDSMKGGQRGKYTSDYFREQFNIKETESLYNFSEVSS